MLVPKIYSDYFQTLRKHYNRFSHGGLSAKCVLGRFDDFRNSISPDKDTIKYENSLTFRGNDYRSLTDALILERLRKEPEDIYRFRYKIICSL